MAAERIPAGLGPPGDTVSFHQEILTLRQREVLLRLGPPVNRHGFHLGGGTAIALHLGHRRSVDFDYADEEEPRPSMLWKVSWREVKETLRRWVKSIEV